MSQPCDNFIVEPYFSPSPFGPQRDRSSSLATASWNSGSNFWPMVLIFSVPWTLRKFLNYSLIFKIPLVHSYSLWISNPANSEDQSHSALRDYRFLILYRISYNIKIYLILSAIIIILCWLLEIFSFRKEPKIL